MYLVFESQIGISGKISRFQMQITQTFSRPVFMRLGKVVVDSVLNFTANYGRYISIFVDFSMVLLPTALQKLGTSCKNVVLYSTLNKNFRSRKFPV